METEMGQPGREEKKKRQRKRGREKRSEKKGKKKGRERGEKGDREKTGGKAEERKAQASDKIIEENRLRNPV